MLNNSRRHGFAKYVMLSPALFVVFATAAYPMANALWLSFQEWQLSKTKNPNGFVGLDNYVRAFGDRFFINSVVVTIEYTILSVALTLVLAVCRSEICYPSSSAFFSPKWGARSCFGL